MILNIERANSLAILQAHGWNSVEHVLRHIYENGLEEQRPGFIRLINGYMTSGLADDGKETSLVWQTWLGATCLWEALWLKERMYDPNELRTRWGDQTLPEQDADFRQRLLLKKAEAVSRINAVLSDDPNVAIEFFYSQHPIAEYRKNLHQMMEGWTWSSAAETDFVDVVWQAYDRLAAIIEAVYLREDIPGKGIVNTSCTKGTLPVY